MVLAAFCSNLSKGGGVPGGVLDGELVVLGLGCKGGTQAKQTLLGQGPKFIPPQLVHGGVGGGVHGAEPLLGWGRCSTVGPVVGVAGGEDGVEVGRDLPQSPS